MRRAAHVGWVVVGAALAGGCPRPAAPPSVSPPAPGVVESDASHVPASGADGACAWTEALGVGDAVPISVFSAAAADWPAFAEAGINLVGPYYGPPPEAEVLDAAAAAGLGVVYPVGVDAIAYGRKEVGLWTGDELATRLAAQVSAVAAHPAVRAWYLVPEELRFWVPEEMAYLEAAATVIRGADERGRDVVIYQPTHRDGEQLAHYAPLVDSVLQGGYVNYAGHADERVWIRWVTQEVRAADRRAGKAPRTWVVPEMFRDPDNASPVDARRWAFHDVFAGVAEGACAVMIYSGHRRAGFDLYDAYMGGYLAAARVLNVRSGFGRALVHGRRDDTIAGLGDGPSNQRFGAAGSLRSMPAVKAVGWRHGDDVFVLVVNSAAEPQTVAVGGLPDGALARGEALVGGVSDDGTIAVGPWGVAIVRAPVRTSGSAG